jgi:hypothetical protein
MSRRPVAVLAVAAVALLAVTASAAPAPDRPAGPGAGGTAAAGAVVADAPEPSAPARSAPTPSVPTPPGPTPSGPAIRGSGTADVIPGHYIVVFADGSEAARRPEPAARAYAGRFGGTVTGIFDTAVRGFTVRMDPASAAHLAAEPGVSYVEQDRAVVATDVQNDPPWGLDRLDQRSLPLSGSYRYTGAGNVTAYILDSGIRLSHREFGGRARSGYDFVDHDSDASDCNGHGTHVAGIVGGSTYGVAKDVKLVSVRVLNCKGTATYSQIIAGVNWVARHAVKPAVANMSLGGPGSAALDTAVRNSIAAGVTFVAAAGNSSVNACAMSPARVPAALTVGATDRADARASFSNYGDCLDLFAPGVNILSAYRGGDRTAARMNGTSMAAPHVAGAAALYLAGRPDATPREVGDALVAAATTGRVTARRGSPNALLNTADLVPPPVTVAGVGCGPWTVDRAVTIGDRRTVASGITVNDCAGPASTRSTVRVRIRHGDRGDLGLVLVAPDGTAYRLRNAVPGDNWADLTRTYTVDASARTRRGTWSLRVTDHYAGSAGVLESWTLSL